MNILRYWLLCIVLLPVAAGQLEGAVDGLELALREYNSQGNVCMLLAKVHEGLRMMQEAGPDGFGAEEAEQVFGKSREILLPAEGFDFRLEAFPKGGSHTLLVSLEPSKKAVGAYVDSLRKPNSTIDEEKEFCVAAQKERVKIRRLFEGCLPEFPNWYFERLGESLEAYFLASGSHEFIVEQLAHLARSSDNGCYDAYADFGTLKIEHSQGNAEFSLWEEKQGKMPVPYYRFRYMPKKDVMRDIIRAAVARELENTMMQDPGPQRMEKIRQVSDRYGGSLDVLLTITEDRGNLLEKHITVSPEKVFWARDHDGQDVDIRVSIDFDMMYEFMEYASAELVRTRGPHWAEPPAESNSREAYGIISRGFKLWFKGVSVRPITEVPRLLWNLRLLIGALGD